MIWYGSGEHRVYISPISISAKEKKRSEVAASLDLLIESMTLTSALPSSDLLERCQIFNRVPKSTFPRPTSGRILLHARQQVSGLRERLGIGVCIFKIGVTANPVLRFKEYFQKKYTHMWIIFSSPDLGQIHMLEAALIALFHTSAGCRNAPNTGGEGALNRKNHGGPPFYVYVTAARGDQAKWIG